jgi:hypothetical protein
MGTWSPYIYDNDMAIDFMSKVIYNGFKIANINDEYLVIADLFHKYYSGLSIENIKIISDKLILVINEEMSENYINDWKEELKETRIIVLSNLLTHINTIRKENNIK